MGTEGCFTLSSWTTAAPRLTLNFWNREVGCLRLATNIYLLQFNVVPFLNNLRGCSEGVSQIIYDFLNLLRKVFLLKTCKNLWSCNATYFMNLPQFHAFLAEMFKNNFLFNFSKSFAKKAQFKLRNWHSLSNFFLL